MQRIVDLSSDGLHIAVNRGFLTVSKKHEEQGRIALDDIGGVVAHAHGLTWSNNAFARLSERSIPVILCAQNHAPIACVWPLDGHHLQGARLNAQVDMSRPLAKRLWKSIVIAKVRMQGAVLASIGADSGAFDMLARKVKSGDPENVEAQAARRYWKALMGEGFRRDRDANDANTLLNYGYTVLRAVISRAICAAGLHPAIGLHHANRGNAFALADDLMEPYRPFVDRTVVNLVRDGAETLTTDAKAELVALTTLDLPTPDGKSPLQVHANRLAQQLASIFQAEQKELPLPTPLDPLEWNGLGRKGG